MQNRRRSQRNAMAQAGRLSAEAGDFSAECLVVDMSTSGARVMCEAADTVPDALVLHLPATQARWPARVVRRRGQELGMRFW